MSQYTDPHDEQILHTVADKKLCHDSSVRDCIYIILNLRYHKATFSSSRHQCISHSVLTPKCPSNTHRVAMYVYNPLLRDPLPITTWPDLSKSCSLVWSCIIVLLLEGAQRIITGYCKIFLKEGTLFIRKITYLLNYNIETMAIDNNQPVRFFVELSLRKPLKTLFL